MAIDLSCRAVVAWLLLDVTFSLPSHPVVTGLFQVNVWREGKKATSIYSFKIKKRIPLSEFLSAKGL